VGEAIRKRDLLRAWVGRGGGIDGQFAVLCGALGIGGARHPRAVSKAR